MGYVGSLAADLEKCPFCGNKKGLMLRLNKQREWVIVCPDCLAVMVEPVGLPPKFIHDQLITFEYFRGKAYAIWRDCLGSTNHVALIPEIIEENKDEQLDKVIQAARERLIRKWNNRYGGEKNESK